MVSNGLRIGWQREPRSELVARLVWKLTQLWQGQKLTLKNRRLSLAGFTSTLKGATVEEIQKNTVWQLLHVFIGEAGSPELSEMVALDHVARCGVVGGWTKHQVPIFIDTHAATLPQKGIWELNIDFANLNGLDQILTRRGWGNRVTKDSRRGFLFFNR